MSKEVKVYVEICREDVILPAYAKPGDAGMDVRAAEDVIIGPKETKVIPTGLKVAIPVGYEIQVRPRSGLSLKTPLRVANSPGTIDAGYRDEIGIIMTNTAHVIGYTGERETYTLESKGNKQGTYEIKKGDRIAQLVLKEVPTIVFEKVDNVSEIGENRHSGLGETGIK